MAAGMRPRSLTVNPWSRAQDLSSAVPTRPETFCVDSIAAVSAEAFWDVLDPVPALRPRFAAAAGTRLADADTFFAVLLEGVTRVTLYMAPRTRIAS